MLQTKIAKSTVLLFFTPKILHYFTPIFHTKNVTFFTIFFYTNIFAFCTPIFEI